VAIEPAKRARRKRALGVGLLLVPSALFSILGGCEYVSNLGYYTSTDAGTPDGGGGGEEGCTACGTRCCPSGTACVDGRGEGVCEHDVVELSPGVESACAVLADGTLWCWGGNQYGTIGVGPEGDDSCIFTGDHVACRFKPVQVEGLRNVVQVSSGERYTCAVERDDSVWCWGRNDDGVLGHAPGTSGDHMCPANLDGGPDAEPCNATPQRVPGLSAVTVATSTDHTCVIEADASVDCWGSNSSGGLGDPSIDGGVSTPHRVLGLPPVSQVSVGTIHSCAIAADGGGVWCWGRDSSGQLGHPADLDHEDNGLASYTPLPVTTPVVQGDASVPEPFTGAVSVRVGFPFSCALRGDRTVWCWGGSVFGTLGTVDDRVQRSPVQMQKLGAARAIDTRFAHVCTLIDNGSVSCWGDDYLGELGQGGIAVTRCSTSGQPCSPTPQTVVTLSNQIAVATGTGFSLSLGDDHRTIWAWGSNDTARLGHTPKSDGDFINCADNLQSVCNPVPRAFIIR